MNYLDYLKIINNGYDPDLILGKGGLNYHMNRNILGEGFRRIEGPGKITYEDDSDYSGDDEITDYLKEEAEEEKKINKRLKDEEDEEDKKNLQEFEESLNKEKEENIIDIDTVYKDLIEERKNYIKVDEKEWFDFEQEPENEELIENYNELNLNDLNDTIKELESGDYELPFIPENTTDFEEKFLDHDISINFLEQTVEGFDINDIEKDKNGKFKILSIPTGAEEKWITENGRNKKIYIPYVNNGVYKGEKLIFEGEEIKFTGDPFYPIDTIIYIKLKNGEIKKYAIEEKFYNNIAYYTGEKNKKGLVDPEGDNLSYVDLCNRQHDLYDDYKKNVFKNIGELKDILDTEEYQPKKFRNQNKIKELNDKIKELESITKDNVKFNDSFNKNRYGYYIPMKYTKMGYDFPEGPIDENDYNDKKIYKHMKRIKKDIITQLKYDKNGLIEGTNKNDDNYKYLKNCNVIYAISFKDAILGMNYTNMLAKNNSLIGNPLKSHKLVVSPYLNKEYDINSPIYGKKKRETDSIGLKLEEFKLIKKKYNKKK